MHNIIVTSVSFSSTVFLHIFFHKFLMIRKTGSFKAGYIFLPGFFLNLIAVLRNSSWQSDKPYVITSIVLYAVLTVDYILFILTSYLGYISPSSRILIMLKTGPKTLGQIISGFHNDEEIRNRLQGLDTDRLITSKSGKYYLLPRGLRFLRFVTFYRSIFRLLDGG